MPKTLSSAAKKELSKFEKFAPDNGFTLEELNNYVQVYRNNKDGKKGKRIGCFRYEIAFVFNDANRSRKGEIVPIKNLTDDDIKEAIKGVP